MSTYHKDKPIEDDKLENFAKNILEISKNKIHQEMLKHEGLCTWTKIGLLELSNEIKINFLYSENNQNEIYCPTYKKHGDIYQSFFGPKMSTGFHGKHLEIRFLSNEQNHTIEHYYRIAYYPDRDNYNYYDSFNKKLHLRHSIYWKEPQIELYFNAWTEFRKKLNLLDDKLILKLKLSN